MKAYLLSVLVAILAATLAKGKLGLPGGPQKLGYDAIDVLKIQLNAEVGDVPGTITFTTPEDPEKKEAILCYTNYETCSVVDVEYHGHQCSLWTKAEVKDAVPQDCIDHFVDTCGVVVRPHSRDLCQDDEGGN